MSGVIAPYNEKKFIEALLKNKPDFLGWAYKDNTDDWFFIRHQESPQNLRYFSNTIVNIETSKTKNVFNEFGRSPKALVCCHLDEPSKIIDPIQFFDLNQLTVKDFENYNDIFCYNQGHDGLAIGVVRLKLKDRRYHTFCFTQEGYNVRDLTFNDKLCVNGLLADKYMMEGPSKKFGTVMRNKLPYLCSSEGVLLNTEKKKLYDDNVDIYAYVNSDRTFFYSKDPNDPKWY